MGKRDQLIGLHVRVPAALYKALLAERDAMRKKEPMANLSDAIRAVIERGARR